MPLTLLHHFQIGTHDGTIALAGGGLALAPGAREGSWTSPVHRPDAPFDWAVASWNGDGGRVEVQVRVAAPGGWSPWFTFGPWSLTGERRSVDGQTVPGVGRLATDTLLLSTPARSWQMRVLLGQATLRRVALATAVAAHRSPDEPYAPAHGRELPVPLRSQMIYPNGGNVWCSPTSLAMVMAFWGHDESIPDQVVPGVFDSQYDGHGNWPFNTAYAGAKGFTAYVDRLSGFPALEQLVAQGFPVIASVAYQKAWLPNAPIDQTQGHLLVVRGFTDQGDVIVNDPAAADDAGVRLVYARDAFRRAWLDRGGVIYMVYPEGHPAPH